MRWALWAAVAACGGSNAKDTSPPTAPDTSTAPTTDTEETGDTADDTSPTQPPDPWTLDDLAGRCPLDGSTRVGVFEIAHWGTFGTVAGSVAEGVVPAEVLTPQETQGDCALYQRFYPFCDPPCLAGETCDHDGSCIPYPERKSVGTVDIIGTTAPITLEPDAANSYWDTALPFPLFVPGSLISVTATGGDLDGFSLRGIGVEDLVLVDESWVVVGGADLAVTWVPSKSESRIAVTMSVDQHGNSPVTLMCAFDDVGLATVPAELLETLVRYGVSGFASGSARRITADSVDHEAGCVELQVYSHADPAVSVEGHVPCFTPGDCPDGYTCDVETNTCVPE